MFFPATHLIWVQTIMRSVLCLDLWSLPMLGFEPEKIWDLYPFNHSLAILLQLAICKHWNWIQIFWCFFWCQSHDYLIKFVISTCVYGITVRWEIGCFTLRKINYNLVFAIYRNKLINSYNIKNNYMVLWLMLIMLANF
jgi:hypothetical protein